MLKLEKFFAIFFIVIFSGCNEKTQNDDVVKTLLVPLPTKQMRLTAEENAVFNIRLKNMVVEEYTKGSFNRDSVIAITGTNASVSATLLQSEYERNEVAADLRFRNKNLIVEALIKSIDRGAGENYYLKLEGRTNTFSNPRAKMEDGQLNYLANLNKGEKVFLACKGDGMVMGDALLANCLPLEVYARQKVATFAQSSNLDEILRNPTLLKQEIVMAVAFASEMPKDSECARSDFYNKGCLDLVERISIDFGDKGTNTGERTFKLALDKLGIKEY